MKQVKLHNKGFTLVELLVVVAIIAILSVIGITLFSSAQQNARDARRKSDIDAIAKALEIKRQPSIVYYVSLLNTDFSSGAIPTDTTTAQYCIKVYTAENGARTETNPTVWNADGNGAAVVGTVCPSSYRKATTDNGFLTTYFPVDTEKSWKVCAILENTNASPNVYCKNSAQ
ncbi:hypothetical protein A3C26_03770 [Candidatus Daviesbacteria bacterium RIFCSPHIGHO2_02_FULL_39_12]|uniref:Type II secretion system protein GspG C-terminal domain-containing protein n=2 Tax=Candidatus Daviesiibacteriota TaxID=1752718 RepID=A0A1F5JCB3_9BACT|nr:MAG: hypothetical protein A3C26_03770 [Candidatus Daviesbacteria bacterium RIFCSPHIGHO2_02_FULL_39_12]OGE71659.1 MAG: hypothetical protein A3H40_01465 [Candidatus Daviesbacteria bacterium RIFCSPLOWO2_02_FULL_38_15]